MADDRDQLRAFEDLMDTGMLWLINTTVLHPRGFTMSIELDDDGKAIGWHLYGSGTERWTFEDAKDAPPGTPKLDDRFAAAQRLLAPGHGPAQP